MLIDKVREDLTTQLKAGNTAAVLVLRMLMTALSYKASQIGGELKVEDEIAVVKSEIKKRQEAIEAFGKAGQEEKVATEKAELDVLSNYLPQQASEDEIRMVVKAVIEEMGRDNRGQLIGRVVAQVGRDKCDGTVVARIVNEEVV